VFDLCEKYNELEVIDFVYSLVYMHTGAYILSICNHSVGLWISSAVFHTQPPGWKVYLLFNNFIENSTTF
jgi:hypothetical protein